jgi:ubiquinone/menaquinone biosynthesis C-methylase UbiE
MTTSWQNSKKWYNDNVGEEGHYYHRTLIIPNTLKLLNLHQQKEIALLDLACGQGVLSRHLPEWATYQGFDLSTGLIQAAQKYHHTQKHSFNVADVTCPLKLAKTDFTHAVIMLAIQNIENPLKVFQNAFKHLKKGGELLVIMNHPCYRIPRQSSWGVDTVNKIQYRRVDRYMSALKIPIKTHPGKGEFSPETWTFHHPLSSYSRWLKEAGFCIKLIEEWSSNKVSEGGAAKMENRSRDEIPMFMALFAVKGALVN